ncbi:hypothetical protein IWX92DRAFT_180351 [Phyllosticta citricarpa]
MCRYRYMYYSGCCHAKLTLYDYCDDAYDAASLPTTPQGDCGEADKDALNHNSEQVESHTSPHLTEFPPLANHSQHQRAVDDVLVDDADRRHGTQRRQTYASIARSSTQKTEPAPGLNADSRSKRTNESIALGTRASREQADRGARSAGGRCFAKNTTIWGGNIILRRDDKTESNLPKQATGACALDLNLDSPNDFPDLRSQAQAGPSSSSFVSEPRSRSDSTASWAQVARLTSAVR